MKRTLKAMTALLALTSLTACDRSAKADLSQERVSAGYRSAMADYNAGRLDEAAEGFRKVCREEPANASARFQLASILQNGGKDHLGALLAYAEYLNQQPESDKAPIARSRMAVCEKELARELAKKYGLDSSEQAVRETEAVRSDLAAANKRLQRLDADLAQAMRRIASLNVENDRLKDALRDTATDRAATASAAGSSLSEAKAILADSDAAAGSATEPAAPTENRLKDVREILNDADATADDRRKNAADVAQLRLEEKSERAFGAALLPEQPADAKAKRAEAEQAAAKARAEELKKNAPVSHPPYYVVEEGDTLYKIAVRFYGHASAWKGIRNANKAVISTDGRVKVGTRLRLP